MPHPVVPTPPYATSVENGIRTPEGAPGPNYWQNFARYEIEAVLSPSTQQLNGEARITYFNNSPDPLPRIYLHLRQNLHRPDALRNRKVPITGGALISSVRLDGTALIEQSSLSQPGYYIDGTVMRVELGDVLVPGDSVQVQVAWSFEVPGVGTPRMGQDGEVYLLAYWYPQVAVYDDVVGWDLDHYLGTGEFYMGFADYDVRLTVPEGWLVAATGSLLNESDVLAPFVRARLAALTNGVTRVVTEAERDSATATSDSGALSWHFMAKNVRDFVFAASNRYVWDATLTDIPGGGTVITQAFYRPEAASWELATEYLEWSLLYLSERLTPYPYPHMTAVEGLITGGMEYPMMTLIGGNRSPLALFRVAFHEVAHMWYPMLVAQNEKAFGWMDEGLVSLLTEDALRRYWGDDAVQPYNEAYVRVAGTGNELPPMRHSDQFPRTAHVRTTALYGKTSVALRALRVVLGEEVVAEALRAYTERWTNGHPYAWDLFSSFDDVAGQDLSWFWSTFFFETWTLDHAIAAVHERSDGIEVVVEDRDWLPLPVVVQATYEDGRVERQVIPVERWLSGATSASVRFPAGDVREIRLDPTQSYPDLNRENDVWTQVEELGARDTLR